MLTFETKRAITIEGELEPKYYIKGDCLSTDTKPIEGVANGSELFEMDTWTSYKFDEENGSWLTEADAAADEEA